MGHKAIAELASLLLVAEVRDNDMDQPSGASHVSNSIEPKIKEAIQIMKENFAEPLSITEISTQVGISLRQLERCFKKVFQKSPGRYYRQIRIKRARPMVTRSNSDIIDIAIATGFGSTSTFSREYKQEYLVSPTMDRANRKLNSSIK